MKPVVADSGPLIVLAGSDLLDSLRRVAGDLLVPSVVFAECTRSPHRPGAAALLKARSAGLLSVPAEADISALGNVPVLDAGEIAVLALALLRRAPVLMDERAGRQIAALHGIPVVGSGGILLAAKRRGLIPAVAPILDEWQSRGYFLSPSLRAGLLERAGET